MTGVSAAGVEPALANIQWKICSAKEFERYAGVWDELNQATAASPALTAEFFTALLREFGTGRELLAIGYRGETAQAITLLLRKNIGFWETFQPAQAPLGAWIHRPPHTLASLVTGLLRALPGFAGALGITQQDPELVRRPDTSATAETLDYIETARVTIAGTFDEYWAKRGKNLRNNTKKQHNRLAKDGVALHLDTITEPAEVAQAIDDYGRLESAGWKAAGGTAIHPANAQGRFYRAVLEAYCRHGAGRIYRYRYGDLIVAMDLCIESRDTLIVLKTTYDESIRDSSPASLMRHEYFRRIFDEARIKRVEFYGKVMDWHTKWSDEMRVLYHANFYRSAAVLKARGMLRRRATAAAAEVALPAPATAPTEATAAPAPAASRTWRLFPATEFGKHAPAWQALLSEIHNSPVLEPDFVSAALGVFARGNELLAICGDERAPAAMCVVHRVGPFSWQTFQPSQAPLGLWLHGSGETWEQLLPGLMAKLPGTPLVLGISQKSDINFARPRGHDCIRTLDFAETARIVVNQSFDEYWESRDEHTTRQIKRRLRRLSEVGIEPRLEAITDPAAMHGAVEEFGRMESAGWKGALGTAVRIDNIQGVFYSRMMREFCARGSGVVYRYRFNGTTVAMELCVNNADTVIMLKTAYDESHAKYGPGILMRHSIFEHIFATGRIRKIEFLGKLQPWQLKWCNEIYQLYHVNYYRFAVLAKMDAIRRNLHPLQSDAPAAGQAQVDHRTDGAAPAGSCAVRRYTDLPALRRHNETLLADAGNTSLFHTLPWYQNFIRTVSVPNHRLRIYAVSPEKNPRAAQAVLLMQHRDSRAGGVGSRTLSGLSNYYTSLFGPVIDPGVTDMQKVLDTLAAGIVGDEIRWDVIDLHPLAADPPVFPGLIAAFRKTGMLVRTYFCFGNWYLQVRGRSYAEYFQTLPSQLRSTITRKRKQFEKYARSKIVLYRDADGLDEALRAYEQIYAASWKVPEPYPLFIRGLCRACAESGWLRLGIAYIDDQPAAAQLWIVTDGTANIYKLAYDERFARFSLGTILAAHLMEHVIDTDKVHEVDYLTGDDAYKKDWMSDRRERWGIVAFNLRTPWGALAAMRHLSAHVVKRAINAIGRLGGTGA